MSCSLIAEMVAWAKNNKDVLDLMEKYIFTMFLEDLISITKKVERAENIKNDERYVKKLQKNRRRGCGTSNRLFKTQTTGSKVKCYKINTLAVKSYCTLRKTQD